MTLCKHPSVLFGHPVVPNVEVGEGDYLCRLQALQAVGDSSTGRDLGRRGKSSALFRVYNTRVYWRYSSRQGPLFTPRDSSPHPRHPHQPDPLHSSTPASQTVKFLGVMVYLVAS